LLIMASLLSATRTRTTYRRDGNIRIGCRPGIGECDKEGLFSISGLRNRLPSLVLAGQPLDGDLGGTEEDTCHVA
jgi:hypothetical protein